MESGLYKRLFEVRVLHEYHLSDRQSGGDLFFNRNPLERQELLPKLLQERKIDILQHLTFEPTPETLKILKGNRIKFWQNATGFVLAAEVKKTEITPGVEAFKLAIPIEHRHLSFYIKVKDPKFYAYSAIKLIPNMLGAYFWFSNAGQPVSNSAILNLAKPTPAVVAGQSYEPGELAVIGGSVSQALVRTQELPAANWTSINLDGFAGEQDRILTGKRMRLRWNGVPKKVAFILKDQASSEVKKIEKEIDKNGVDVLLDFTRTNPEPDFPNGRPVPDGLYTLEIDGTPTPVFLHDEIVPGNPAVARPGIVATPKGLLGIIHIDTKADTSFIEPNGALKQLPLPDGALSHQIYEVRWLNRSLNWRYRSDRGKKLLPIGSATGHLFQDGNDLQTTLPHRFHAQQANLAPGVNIPTPTPDQVRFDASGALFGELLIHKIRDLIDSV
ncbi:MAG: hypothetical protein JNJ57_15675 [Saprospiraceae bacterium]|nr:hypothetical protein [Saprospiraceae bacterium]